MAGRSTKLSDLATIVGGGTLALEKKGAVKIGPFGSQLKKNELKEQGIKVFGQENVIQNDFTIGERFIDQAKFDTLRSVQLFPGDVVLTMMGSLGAATVVPDGAPAGIMDSHLLRIQPDTSLVERGFLARVLRDSGEIKKQILARSQGGIMSGLNAKIVRTLEVPIPPLPEQRKIAAILSSVDDAIEKTQAVIDQVQVVKRGLMQELLTRGLPGRHARFKQTEIRGVPETWIDTVLGNVLELKRGYDLPRQNRTAGTVPVISSSGATDTHGEARVKGPGVVTGRYGNIGQVFFVNDDYWPLNTTLYVRDFKGNDPRFISHFLRGLDFSAHSGKTAVPGVNRNHLHRTAVVFPPDIGEQRAIAAILSSVDDVINRSRSVIDSAQVVKTGIVSEF